MRARCLVLVLTLFLSLVSCTDDEVDAFYISCDQEARALFFRSGFLDFIISLVGVVLFMGLTIWDTKRIVAMNQEYGAEMTSTEHTKLGIIGALNLYLDFINIFLYLLRIYAASDRD